MNNKLFLPLLHKFPISTRRLKFVGNKNYQPSCLLAYDAVLLGLWFPVFQGTVAPSSCLTLKMKAQSFETMGITQPKTQNPIPLDFHPKQDQ
jgi:hypothetical protein